MKTSLFKLVHAQSRTYWRMLSWKSYIQFLFSIFLIFSCIGYLNDIMSGGQFTVQQLIGNIILSGVTAAAWVFSFTHNIKILPLAILLVAGNFFYTGLWPAAPATHALQTRLITDSIGIILHLLVGYIFLIQFIMTEGRRHIRLETEMKLAKDLHDILVPVIDFKKHNFEVYGQAVPTDKVGGDLVDIYEHDDNLTCYIADVSGHGVAAGLLMGMFKTAMHTFLQKGLSIAELLTGSNQVLYRLKKRSMFITCACIRFFPDDSAEYSVAGHLPILHANAESNAIDELHVKQIPVTAKKNFKFQSNKLDVNSGDLLLMLTDGLTEVEHADGDEFGIDRIKTILAENRRAPLQNIFQKIMAEVRKFGPQRDDQTMLLIRRL